MLKQNVAPTNARWLLGEFDLKNKTTLFFERNQDSKKKGVTCTLLTLNQRNRWTKCLHTYCLLNQSCKK